MISTTLGNFNKLKNGNDVIRINAGVKLLHRIHGYSTDHICTQDDEKELNYILNRLVRSLGSSTTFGRKGFYSTLTVFLKMMMHHENSIEKLLSIMNTQLHPVGSNSKSENANIYMGHILLCGALIRSNLLVQNTIKIQQQIVQILLKAGEQRSYLSFISAIFLGEFIVHLDVECMKTAIWPIIKEQFGKPWSEQTLDTFYILLVIKDKHPLLLDYKFSKKYLHVEDVICKKSIEDIIKLLMNLPRSVSCHHPVFKLFCEKLVSSDIMADFLRSIDQKFIKPSKNDEYIVIEILRLILPNIMDKTVIPSLLSPNFLQHMLKRFSNCKKNNNDEALVAFKEVLNLMVHIISDKDVDTETQLNMLRKFMLYPGDIMIEKKTGTKVIQTITRNLKFDGIKNLSELYRDIIINSLSKEKGDGRSELWTNAERSYAAQLLTRLMGHSETLLELHWRHTQLFFLFNYGISVMPNVGIDLALQLKDSFYRALDYKLPKLDHARSLLNALVSIIDKQLRFNNIPLRSPFNDTTFNAWTKVTNLNEKLENATENAQALPIFHTINLHMGLQLFSDPEMAITSINELQCCYERLIKYPREHIQDNATIEEELHWVEVAVDLLLSFLSRNNHLLRSLVGCVFPHICPYLTSSAVYQILAVLDVKNDFSALMKDENENSDAEENESDSDDDDDDDDDNDNDDNDDDDENYESVSYSEISSKDSEAESDNEILSENEALTDRLRIAVHRALGDAINKSDEEDIDVDQINDEDARRLDKSLAAAFKILRVNRQGRRKKQEKTEQALTHFRVRVMDLLDIYIETCPSMTIIVDMIVPLFSLLEFCIKDPHQKPLEHRVRACLKKLATIKKFNDVTNVDENLLITVLKVLMEKGERSSSVYEEINDKLAECCTFLVRYMQHANLPTGGVVGIYVENLTAFFKKRDCVLSFMLFKDVLQLCWKGNWELASALVDFAFDNTIRYFRRSQALELLLIFYNNSRLQKMDTTYENEKITLETKLYNNIIHTFGELSNPLINDNGQSVSVSVTDVPKKVQQKFIGLLLILLRVVYASHLPQVWNWQKIQTTLSIYTKRNILSKDVKVAYKKLEMKIGAPVHVSSIKDDTDLNHSINTIAYDNDEQNKTSNSKEETSLFNNNVQKKKKRNRSEQKDKQVSKKEAYNVCANVTSKDLKTRLKSSQKRDHGQTIREDGEVKKRKQSTN